MDHFAVPTALLLATVAGLAWVRARSLRLQVSVEAALILALGGWLLSSGSSPLPAAGQIAKRADGAWLQAVAGIWWLVAARLAVTGFGLMRGRSKHSKEARLLSDLVSGAIYLCALLIVLNSILDLPLRGLLATSGIVAIVVGLALQSTLADLFSGIAVGIEQSIHAGDHVSIADEAEGVVVQMNWRSVHLRTLEGDIATVPNSVVAKSRIVNHSRPTTRRTTTTDLETWSDQTGARVLEVARRALLLCPSILDVPAPTVAIKEVRGRRLVLAATYSVEGGQVAPQARGELLQNFRRMQRHERDRIAIVPTKDFLGEVTLFETLSEDQLSGIADAVATRQVEPGDRLFDAGTTGSTLFIVRSGVFDVVREEDEIARSLGRIGPGEYIGELSMMTGEPRYVSVTALTPASILELDREPLQALIREDERLGRALESSVRRGMDLVDRDVAARSGPTARSEPGLLRRLATFFGR